MIKASDALGTLSDELRQQYREAERIIDRRIKEMSDDDGLTVDLHHVTTSPRVLRRLEQAYRDGGWDAMVEYGDQRDPGPFFRLSVSSPPRSGPGGA